MKSPLEQIDELGDFIRQLHKISSKIYAGQEVPAYRDVNRLIGVCEAKKDKLIKAATAALNTETTEENNDQ